MNCWICGGNADTGEHRTKKSDLGMVFKDVSLENPIYTKNKYGNFVKIGSLDSNRFKSRAKICLHCNSNRTQPHDKAWQKLSEYLQAHTTDLRNKNSIQLQKIFPGATKKSLLHVHLFYLKIFGCLILEHNVSIPIEPFSKAILTETEHSQVYIGIGYLEKGRGKNIIQISPIESVKNNEEGITHFVSWQYLVNDVFVDICYSYIPEYTRILRNSWQPSSVNKIMKFARFKPIRNLDLNEIFK